MIDFFTKYAHRVDKRGPDECWPWTGARITAGYGNFRRDKQHHYSHRAAYEAANGLGSAGGLVVRHRCDNPPCVNPRHLLSGTHKDNVHDCHERGRNVIQLGEDASMTKLTAVQVSAARAAVNARTATIAAIARKYGVSRSSLRQAVIGRTWSHLSAPVVTHRKGRRHAQ